MRARAVSLVVAAIWALGVPCLAQAPSGTIAGHVVSADGQALPGVTVSVMGAALQGTRTAVSSDSGDYLVPLLPPGDYTLAVEVPPWKLDGRDYGRGGTLRAPVRLEPAASN